MQQKLWIIKVPLTPKEGSEVKKLKAATYNKYYDGCNNECSE